MEEKNAYYEKNKEKMLAQSKAYYERNKEKVLAYQATRKEQNSKNSLAYYYRNKDARKEAMHKRRTENYDKVRVIEESSRLRRFKSDPIAYKLRNLRASARRRGLEFNLAREDLAALMVDVCPVLGVKMHFNIGKCTGGNYDSFSVDRIDNSKGYVKGNIQIMCKRANSIKSDATLEELEKLVAYMRKQQGDK